MAEKREVSGIALLARRVPLDSVKTLREIGDRVRRKMPDGIIVLGGECEGKVALIALVSEQYSKRLQAGSHELRDQTPGAIVVGQFVNPANPQAHYEMTGPEIWADTEGDVNVLVAGVGTGGTISGARRFLKEQKPSVRAWFFCPGCFTISTIL